MKKLIGQKVGCQKYPLSLCKGAQISSTSPNGQNTWFPSESCLNHMLPIVGSSSTYKLYKMKIIIK
jgi:hypothetical protein